MCTYIKDAENHQWIVKILKTFHLKCIFLQINTNILKRMMIRNQYKSNEQWNNLKIKIEKPIRNVPSLIFLQKQNKTKPKIKKQKQKCQTFSAPQYFTSSEHWFPFQNKIYLMKNWITSIDEENCNSTELKNQGRPYISEPWSVSLQFQLYLSKG